MSIADQGMGLGLRAVRLLAGSDLLDRPGIRGSAERVLYRAAQEALRNVIKHADADAVAVSVDRQNGRVALTITDDGRGAGDAQAREGHLGLRMVQDLAADIGGDFALRERPEGGTAFRFEVPAS